VSGLTLFTVLGEREFEFVSPVVHPSRLPAPVRGDDSNRHPHRDRLDARHRRTTLKNTSSVLVKYPSGCVHLLTARHPVIDENVRIETRLQVNRC
jgi:hypothetical protein